MRTLSRSGALVAVACALGCAPAARTPQPENVAVRRAAAASPLTPPDAPAVAARETEDAPFRSSPPPLGDASPFTSPPYHSFRLSNGVPVHLLERPARGFVRVEVMLRARPAPLGANYMASIALWLGTKALTEAKLNAANDTDAAMMTTSYAWGWLRVVMTSPPDRTASSIARLAEVVLSPAFPPGGYVPSALAIVEGRSASDDTPALIATRVGAMALYATAPVDDDPEMLRGSDIGAIWRDQVAEAYDAALDPSSSALLVVGDATERSVRPLLEKAFGSWRAHGKHPVPAEVRPTLASSSPRLVVVDHPGSESYVQLVGEGPVYGSPDWAPAMLLARIFDHSKGRAARALRDVLAPGKKASLAMHMRPTTPRALLTLEVPVERTSDALARVDRLLREMKATAPPPADLDAARQSAVLDAPSWALTLANETNIMEGVVVQGEPVPVVPTFAARVLALTAADIQRVDARYLDPDHMKAIVVGDWKKLREELVGLGWGSIELRSPAGAVLGVEPARGP